MIIHPDFPTPVPAGETSEIMTERFPPGHKVILSSKFLGVLSVATGETTSCPSRNAETGVSLCHSEPQREALDSPGSPSHSE